MLQNHELRDEHEEACVDARQHLGPPKLPAFLSRDPIHSLPHLFYSRSDALDLFGATMSSLALGGSSYAERRRNLLTLVKELRAAGSVALLLRRRL